MRNYTGIILIILLIAPAIAFGATAQSSSSSQKTPPAKKSPSNQTQQPEKLLDIRRAANAFVEQLQPEDRAKVIAFSDDIHHLCD